MTYQEAVKACETMGAQVSFYRDIAEVTVTRAGRIYSDYSGHFPTAVQKVIDKLNRNEYTGGY